jgi:hypothetical protein
VTATGGKAPYTYLWDNGAASKTPSITFISRGTYAVTVKDANGCVKTVSTEVKEIERFTFLKTESTDIKCNGSADGRASVTVIGGLAPYTYLWRSNNATTASISNLGPGT